MKETDTMPRWLVELTGAAFDVEEFPYWFPSGGDAYAVAQEGKVFLVGDALEAFTDPADVERAVIQLVEEYFAALRLVDDGLKKPAVGLVIREHDDGRRDRFALLSGTAVGRSKGRAALSGPPGPTQAQAFLAAARSDRRLRTAASLLSLPGATWPHFYVAVEEMESYLGRGADEAGYCTRNQRTRFRRTANSEAAGLDARHRRDKPPEDPMSLTEGRAFASEILVKILRNPPESSHGGEYGPAR